MPVLPVRPQVWMYDSGESATQDRMTICMDGMGRDGIGSRLMDATLGKTPHTRIPAHAPHPHTRTRPKAAQPHSRTAAHPQAPHTRTAAPPALAAGRGPGLRTRAPPTPAILWRCSPGASGIWHAAPPRDLGTGSSRTRRSRRRRAAASGDLRDRPSPCRAPSLDRDPPLPPDRDPARWDPQGQSPRLRHVQV